MRTSYAMMASSVTPPAEDEGAEEDGVVEAEGAIVCVWGCLGLNCAVLFSYVYGTHIQEVGRLRIEDGKMAKESRDSRRKNELITSHRVLIDIYKGEYKV